MSYVIRILTKIEEEIKKDIKSTEIKLSWLDDKLEDVTRAIERFEDETYAVDTLYKKKKDLEKRVRELDYEKWIECAGCADQLREGVKNV